MVGPREREVVEALQRLQNDPEQLAHERDRRYSSESPHRPYLLYSETSETTQPPTPIEERNERMLAPFKATPLNQFKSQSKRERERLEYQRSEQGFGRRQTLPWDDAWDLETNAENNVRSRWVAQGIWANEWGPAWPKGSNSMLMTWRHHRSAPFFGGYGPNKPEYGHTLYGLMPQYPTPITVHNPEASRPYRQFCYQMGLESDWIKDEVEYRGSGTVADVGDMAYQSVKENWIRDQIWDFRWDVLPGMSSAQQYQTSGHLFGRSPTPDVATNTERVVEEAPSGDDTAVTPITQEDPESEQPRRRRSLRIARLSQAEQEDVQDAVSTTFVCRRSKRIASRTASDAVDDAKRLPRPRSTALIEVVVEV
ncbi:hypothetical protein DV738_g4430, partial [Chaetothyriales sp. CBS 135597]